MLTVRSQGSVPLDPLYTLGGGAAVGAAALFENKLQSQSGAYHQSHPRVGTAGPRLTTYGHHGVSGCCQADAAGPGGAPEGDWTAVVRLGRWRGGG